jgi:hypothetical protein
MYDQGLNCVRDQVRSGLCRLGLSLGNQHT